MLASLGIDEVTVYRRLRVAFFSTGDELRSIGQPLGGGRDLRQQPLHAARHADAPGLRGARHGRGARRAGGARARVRHGRGERRRRHHVRRRVGRRSRLRQAAARQAGRGAVLEDRDEARPAARLRPHRRRALLRPARQSGVGDGHLLPVRARRAAASSRARRDVEPRADLRARCSPAPIRKAPGRTEFQRGILSPDAAGGWRVRTTGDQGSGILSSMSRANCFIVLPTECGNVEAGQAVEVQLLEGLI